MPDTPIERANPRPYDPGLEPRVSRLENDVRDIQATLIRLDQTTTRLEAKLDATLPHLATKADIGELRAELADKPSRMYLWGVFTALLTAYAAGLAALAILK